MGGKGSGRKRHKRGRPKGSKQKRFKRVPFVIIRRGAEYHFVKFRKRGRPRKR